MEVFRTSDERFQGLLDFPYDPHYREWRGLRLSHVDEGGGAEGTIVMLHGEPTWSFLWRPVMRPLLDGGYRVVAPDLPGFGRSDKPTDPGWYSYDNYTAAVVSLLEDLDLRDVTLVVHDWGGPIGLRAATTEVPERVARLVVMDTGVFTGRERMSEAWTRFRDFVAGARRLPVGRLVRSGCKSPPPPEVLAAYEAPFPDEASKAGARAFPQMIPQHPDAPGAAAGRAVAEKLAADTRPTLLLWADSDPMLPLETAGRRAEELLPAANGLTVIEDAGHFLQEDRGDHIGELIALWLAGQSWGRTAP